MEYNKVFDSVPRNWILKAREICKVYYEVMDYYLVSKPQ